MWGILILGLIFLLLILFCLYSATLPESTSKSNDSLQKVQTMSTTQKLSENKMPLSIGFVLGSVSTLITSNPTVKALVYQQMKALFPHLDNSQLNDNLSQCSSYLQTIAKTLEEMSTKKSYDL